MNYKKITFDGKTVYRCTGEGQGTCAGCLAKGKWNRRWMCMLYQLTPDDDAPCYCSDCIREVLAGTMEEAKSMDEEEDLILPDDSNYLELK